MNQVNLKVTGYQYLAGATLTLDGKRVKCKKNEFGNVVVQHKTDKSQVSLRLTSYLDCGGPLWFLTQLFFFVISIFGIFDIHRKRSTHAIALDATINVSGTVDVVLRCSRKDKKSGLTLLIDSNPHVMVTENQTFYSAKADRVFKALAVCKLLLGIAIVVGLVFLLAAII